MKLTPTLLVELGMTTDDKVVFHDLGYSCLLEGENWVWKRNGIDLPAGEHPQTLEKACVLLGKFHPTLHLGTDTPEPAPESNDEQAPAENSNESVDEQADQP